MKVRTSPSQEVPGPRLDFVDALRGLVMVLMALDHARDFFHFGALHGIDPLDLRSTTPALFFTRWITHFCAPVFILLAGSGTFLSAARGRPKSEISWFLLTRGLWLILLEMTFVQWAGWTWAINPHQHFALVLWAIGWSMIILGGLIHLPVRLAAILGLALIVGHNACDGLTPAAFGPLAPLWSVLHVGGRIELGYGHNLLAGYPLIPWMGVMAAGYGLGAWLLLEPALRRRRLVTAGLGLIAAFVFLRLTNLYGDPRPWSVQPTLFQSLGSFLHCQKYPPSLCFLLMTLGPALLILAWWDGRLPPWVRPLVIFGRAPMFFYLLHLPLLHGLAVLVSRWKWGDASWLFGVSAPPAPDHVGFGLVGTYAAWLVGVALLYPACHWFAGLKRRRREAWLSYF